MRLIGAGDQFRIGTLLVATSGGWVGGRQCGLCAGKPLVVLNVKPTSRFHKDFFSGMSEKDWKIKVFGFVHSSAPPGAT